MSDYSLLLISFPFPSLLVPCPHFDSLFFSSHLYSRLLIISSLQNTFQTVPHSDYTRTLFQKLDANKAIDLSEHEKADADLDSLAMAFKNNIQYEREKIATKVRVK